MFQAYVIIEYEGNISRKYRNHSALSHSTLHDIANLARDNPGHGTFFMGKKVYIHTFGCQMNVHDSEKMLGILEEEGYSQTDNPSERRS